MEQQNIKKVIRNMDATKTRKRTHSHLWVEIPSAILPWAGGKGRMIKQQNDTRCSNTPWARGPAILVPCDSFDFRKQQEAFRNIFGSKCVVPFAGLALRADPKSKFARYSGSKLEANRKQAGSRLAICGVRPLGYFFFLNLEGGRALCS